MWAADGGDRNRFTAKDLLLLRAYRMYQDSLCACGHPSWLTYEEANSGNFETAEKICQACKQVEIKAAATTERPKGSKSYVTTDLWGAERAPGKHEQRIAARRAAAEKLRS